MKIEKPFPSIEIALSQSSPRSLPSNALIGGRGSSGRWSLLDSRLRGNNTNALERNFRGLWILIVAAALAGGCAIGANSRPAIASYDFGPAPALGVKTILSRPVVVYDVSAPAWMDTAAVFYRLAYRDPARPQAYANNRWVMPPAALLTNRLRQRLSASSSAGVVVPADAIRTEAALRVELDEFAQIFDAAERSRALVRVRATLAGNRIGIRQRAFSVEKAVASADAEGGVRALAAASDEVIEQLLEWLAVQLKG